MKSLKLFFIPFLFLAFLSCKKTDVSTNKKTSSVEDLLLAHTWKMQELRVQQSNNVFVYYNRGGTTNTANYDADSLKFNAGNTGIYYNQGSQVPFTWSFTDPSETRMTMVVNFSTPLTLRIENIFVGETTFYFGEYYVYGGISYVAYGLRIPN